MKALAILVGLVVAVSCRPDKKAKKADLELLKAEAARKKLCMNSCAEERLVPLCAGKQGDKPKSFANECVLRNYNCEHKDTLKEIMKGECPNTQGIFN